MDEQEALAAFDEEVRANHRHGHLLLGQPPAADLDRARSILQCQGGAIVMERHLSPRWLLVTLEGGDIRDAALKLAERGFMVLRGANAAQEHRARQAGGGAPRRPE